MVGHPSPRNPTPCSSKLHAVEEWQSTTRKQASWRPSLVCPALPRRETRRERAPGRTENAGNRNSSECPPRERAASATICLRYVYSLVADQRVQHVHDMSGERGRMPFFCSPPCLPYCSEDTGGGTSCEITAKMVAGLLSLT